MYLSIISILKLKSRPTGTNVEYHNIHSQVNLSMTFCKTGTFNAGRDGHQFCVLATFFKSSYLKKKQYGFQKNLQTMKKQIVSFKETFFSNELLKKIVVFF